MKVLQHIAEPESLFLTWLSPDESAPTRTRRIVGEVYKNPNGQAIFRYLTGTQDFEAARSAGFKGFPPFTMNEKEAETTQNVIEALMRRLPPRKREDFSAYLASHSLPVPFNNSDFALLGYTGARLPSDGFAIVPVFSDSAIPCDYLAEVVGLRHEFHGDLTTIREGDPISFDVDRDNPVDHDALAVLHNGRRIGYINRAFRQTVFVWLSKHTVSASVDRLNGRPTRPLVYIRVSVT